MADDNAVRSRRKRAHAAGDHTLCTSRCDAARRKAHLSPVPAQSAEVLPGPGRRIDPAAALQELAGLAMNAVRADPGNGLLIREARTTLLALQPGPDTGVGDELAILARYLQAGGFGDAS